MASGEPPDDTGTPPAEGNWWTRAEKSVALAVNVATLAVAVTAWISIKQVDDEHQITQQTQFTERYNNAVQGLGSSSRDVRLSNILALQRLMRDSPRDQPTVIDVVSAYIRNSSPKPTSYNSSTAPVLSTDVLTALAVLRNRDTNHDQGETVDLSLCELYGANLHSAGLRRADLYNVDAEAANLSHADLRGAYLHFADMTAVDLTRANLEGADLSGANLGGANLLGGDLRDADLRGASLTSPKNPSVSQATAITVAQLLKAKIDKTTVLPSGLANDPQVRKAIVAAGARSPDGATTPPR